jgi:2-keto-3-deoxy-L-rhamnonate aldolase RhmA
MAQGATLVAVGSDLGALRNATQALADKYIKRNGAPS